MKKIIRLSLFFAAVAAGNFAQAVVIAGQPQQPTSPTGVHDMVAIAPAPTQPSSTPTAPSTPPVPPVPSTSDVAASVASTASQVASAVGKAVSTAAHTAASHPRGFIGHMKDTVDDAIAQVANAMKQAETHVGSHSKDIMLGKFTHVVTSALKKHFNGHELESLLGHMMKQVGKLATHAIKSTSHAASSSKASSSSSASSATSSQMMSIAPASGSASTSTKNSSGSSSAVSTPVMTMAPPATSSSPAPTTAAPTASTVEVQGLGGSAATYAPVAFNGTNGSHGNYWANASGNGLGRAQVGGKNYEAVVTVNQNPTGTKGSIGPAYTWAYNSSQQSAIASSGLNVQNARVIGNIEVPTYSAADRAKAQAELTNLNITTFETASKEAQTKKLQAIINAKETKQLVGIEKTSSPASGSTGSGSTASDSSKMLSVSSTAVSASDAIPAIPTMPGPVILPTAKKTSGSGSSSSS